MMMVMIRTSGTKSIVNLTLETKGPVYGCVGVMGGPKMPFSGQLLARLPTHVPIHNPTTTPT